MKGRVLIVAGSDSGGGAGIQADVKTVTALGGYAATAITALTAQNTQGVFAVFGVPPDFIREQMRVVLSDIGADCLKTGMLHTAEVIGAVAEVVDGEAKGIPLVVDPVMVAKGGESLLAAEARDVLKSALVPRATVITPNVPEAAVLTGREVADLDGMKRAAEAILGLGAAAVLLKGGHMAGETVSDVLATGEGMEVLENPRIATDQTHGTGCTLASAIAAGLAQQMVLRDAVLRARAFVQQAIRAAPGIGRGHGPLDHTFTVRAFSA